MKDEIKGILIQDGEPTPNNPVEIKRLLVNKEAENYITNLQEENEILKQEQIGKYQTLKELQQENERLKALNKEYVYELGLNEFEHTTIIDTDYKDKYLDYKQRNEKAIEYIKNYKNDYAPYELSDYNIRELLNILNGDDE